ncbi:MAG: putative bifunctional diguanylate cyclase/phosphodiesterase [Bradymonadaceae bacterium]
MTGTDSCVGRGNASSDRRSNRRVVSGPAVDTKWAETGDRRTFCRRLESELRRAESDGSHGFAVIRIHSQFARWIDNCFQADGSFGRAVCRRLAESSGDGCLAVRFGREEFAVLSIGVSGPEEAAARAETLLSEMSAPIAFDDKEFIIHASAGVVFGDGRREQPKQVLDDADFALSRAMRSSGPTIELYSVEEQEGLTEALELGGQVLRGLENDEFTLHFQPIVRPGDGGVEGFECLVRWDHPERGLLPAGEFIPVLERSGAIDKLDQWVLRQSCRRLARWDDQHPDDRPFLSVNVSRRELVIPEFGDVVRETVESTAVDPDRLRFELTETAMVEEPETVCSNVEKIGELGGRIWVDDFGVGQSSMACLQRLPVDGIKLDRTFLQGDDGGDRSLVEALLAFGDQLDMEVVVEGVETRSEYERVTDLECDLVQGFYFCRGVDDESATAILEDGLVFDEPHTD